MNPLTEGEFTSNSFFCVRRRNYSQACRKRKFSIILNSFTDLFSAQINRPIEKYDTTACHVRPLLQNMIESLTLYHPNDFRSTSPLQWNIPEQVGTPTLNPNSSPFVASPTGESLQQGKRQSKMDLMYALAERVVPDVPDNLTAPPHNHVAGTANPQIVHRRTPAMNAHGFQLILPSPTPPPLRRGLPQPPGQ
ncbi:hypothetical protein [Ottowia thiooxydans]|uniref:hypothetical protein n=1 Tax=Ottowia thiooxydans TaxID=219182 RepID=UPI0012EB73E7|nr:hypothetical protein [Ottowia thiooxydans]